MYIVYNAMRKVYIIIMYAEHDAPQHRVILPPVRFIADSNDTAFV